jgi:hypothetical protein
MVFITRVQAELLMLLDLGKPKLLEMGRLQKMEAWLISH